MESVRRMVLAFGWSPKKAKPSTPSHSSVVCASNTATAVDMMSAVVKDLCTLEKGVMFDAKSNQNVFVIAPVLAILCDNPRAS